MKSFRKIVAVTLVTALCFIACCIPAFASNAIDVPVYDYLADNILLPSPYYPDSSTLPYGVDTLVYDMLQRANNGYVVYRFYVKTDYYDGSDISAANGLSVFLTSNSTSHFKFMIIAKSPIYYESMYWLDDNPDVIVSEGVTRLEYYSDTLGYYFNLTGTLGTYEDWSLITYPLYYPSVLSNSTFFYGGKQLTVDVINNIPSAEKSQFYSNWFTIIGRYHYLSASESADIRNDELKSSIDNLGDAIDEGVTQIQGSINDASADIQGSINENSEEIKEEIFYAAANVGTVISDGVDEIIDAGGNLPDIDTDTTWMDESLSQMNDWLSQLESFEEQMKQSEEENSENMAQASAFINGFFESIPSLLKAACAALLVAIVVVKIIGR